MHCQHTFTGDSSLGGGVSSIRGGVGSLGVGVASFGGGVGSFGGGGVACFGFTFRLNFAGLSGILLKKQPFSY